MAPLLTLQHSHVELCLLLLHLYCLITYITQSPPPIYSYIPPYTRNIYISHLQHSLRVLLRYYIPNIYPIFFELLSFPYTCDSGTNMKFIKFKNPDVFSIAYAIVAPVTMHHVFGVWIWTMGIWNYVRIYEPSNPISKHFGFSILAWLGAIGITIYTTIPSLLLLGNIAGNVGESILEVIARYLGKKDENEWDKWYWFRLKWGRTWATNLFWWWESNPILLILKFKDEILLLLFRPRYLDRRPSHLPLSNMNRSMTMMDINSARKLPASEYKSFGFSNSCLDLRGIGERPALQHRHTENRSQVVSHVGSEEHLNEA